MKIVSVQRVAIKLGETPLNVYRATYINGSTTDLLAGRNVTDAIGMRQGSLTERMKVKSLKHLPHIDKDLTELQADTGEKFVPVSIKDACMYWGIMSQGDNSHH